MASEIEKLNRGRFVVPESFRLLRDQVWMAFRNDLLVFSSVAKNAEEYPWLDVSKDFDSTLTRLRMSEGYLAADLEELETSPESTADSYGMAMNLLIDRAVKTITGDQSLALEDRSEFSNQIVSSMISLLVLGQVKEALDLAKISDSLAIFEDPSWAASTASFSGYINNLSPYFRRITILQTISSHLQRLEIPRTTLLQESLEMDKGNLSNDLKALKLRDYLPNGRWTKNRFCDGDVYRLDFPDGTKGSSEVQKDLIQKLKKAGRGSLLDLTDNQWALLEPLLRDLDHTPTLDDRAVANGILWILRTGAEWTDLPGRFGSHPLVYRRFLEWEQHGVVHSVLGTLADDLRDRGGIDVRQWFIDATGPSSRIAALRLEELAWTETSQSWKVSTAMLYVSPLGRSSLNPRSPTSDGISHSGSISTAHQDL